MVDMNIDRIRRWKCLLCGSKQKRKMDLKDLNKRTIGYSLMCCNCGHIDKFALSKSGIDVFVCGDESKVYSMETSCPLTVDDMGFCKNTNCKYRPTKQMNCNNGEHQSNNKVVQAPTEITNTEKKKFSF